MPGAHNKRKSKKPNGNTEPKELVFAATDGTQAYAQVTKALGAGRFNVLCADGKERLCKLRGKMRRSEWVCNGDLVLVSLRSELNGDNKGDILLRYAPGQVSKLKSYGELDFLKDEVHKSQYHEEAEDDCVDFEVDEV